MQSTILNTFPITSEEYEELDRKFGKLCHHQSWQLLKKNLNNNCSDDREDMVQEIRIALLTAGSYFKRQTYIESCLNILNDYFNQNPSCCFSKEILHELNCLWQNRTKHGANRQKFGPHQEKLLDRMVKQFIPKKLRPNKNLPLSIDQKFIRYCKQITWNKQKALGKKITREKSIRSGLVSLSNYDYLGVS